VDSLVTDVLSKKSKNFVMVLQAVPHLQFSQWQSWVLLPVIA
jgi:hypothetical protein